MPYKYIGKVTDFKGKTLWEIVGNLKNFGVGRYVARGMFERYPEPCYMKIVKVETLPSPEEVTVDDLRKVKVVVEKVFRGKRLPKLVTIESASYKTDYKLIPKDQEAAYCKFDAIVDQENETKVLPKYCEFPPLLREIIVRELKAKVENVEEVPKMEVDYMDAMQSNYRIAKDGETPSYELTLGVGSHNAPRLYKGI